ncbi:MAG TPA: hypothetical protein VFA81_05105 [Burkholderiales bacterium]|nr:hypothetical protein [Burkholderiales bacterium]
MPTASEIEACGPGTEGTYARDDATRLAKLTERADMFSACMQAKGYVLDQAALDAELLRYEQTRNADRYGVDPQVAVNRREQELQLSPAYWRKGAAR